MEYLYENHDVKGLEVSEASKEQLAEGVLAKVKGPSFFLDGYSRNGRFYPKELWENALKNAGMKSALDRGLMFGCIGHPKDYSLDELLESGKVSHKVTNIYVDKKTGEGMAEYEILDTPSGRILNTVLRSGSEMYVSTRAFGGFTKDTKSKGGKSYKVLDSSNFVIESIDFVIQPGFLETNPKLMESLKEEFEALKEDKYDIKCEDGLCGLKFESQNEVSEPEDVINVKNEGNGLNKELLEELSKEEIITMLENVVNENQLLVKDSISEDEANDKSDMMVSAKLMMNYVSYVELLTKLVRYDVEYEKYYDELIEFLDKDSKLTTDDMGKLDEICANILKEKDVEESIEKTCTRITELAAKINSDGEEDSKNKDGEEKPDKVKKDTEEDTSTEVKAEESFVDFVLSLKTKVVEKEVLVQDEAVVADLHSQLLRMKDATLFITKKLDEEMSKDPIVETEIETKIEYKVPEDINEKFLSLKKEVLELTESEKDVKELLSNSERDVSDIEELYDEVKEELSNLKYSISEKEETDKELFREILEEKKSEFDKIQELYDDMESDYQTASEKLDKATDLNESLNGKLLETKADYYSSMYKLEVPAVKTLMEKHSTERELKEALGKEQKLNRRTTSPIKETEIPEYKPSAGRSKAKASFLENLTR